MFAILGIVAFVLVLYVADSIAAGDGAKTAKFGAALAVCLIIIIGWAPKTNILPSADCWTDWDGRANPTVCD